MNLRDEVARLAKDRRRLEIECGELRSELCAALEELDEAHRALRDVRDRLREKISEEAS